MNIACYLITDGKLKQALMPEELLLGLCKSLRANGKEEVHFLNESIAVEGIYVPAKGSKTGVMVLPSVEDEDAF